MMKEKRKARGFWKDFANVREILLRLAKEHGHLPSQKQMGWFAFIDYSMQCEIISGATLW